MFNLKTKKELERLVINNNDWMMSLISQNLIPPSIETTISTQIKNSFYSSYCYCKKIQIRWKTSNLGRCVTSWDFRGHSLYQVEIRQLINFYIEINRRTRWTALMSNIHKSVNARIWFIMWIKADNPVNLPEARPIQFFELNWKQKLYRNLKQESENTSKKFIQLKCRKQWRMWLKDLITFEENEEDGDF